MNYALPNHAYQQIFPEKHRLPSPFYCFRFWFVPVMGICLAPRFAVAFNSISTGNSLPATLFLWAGKSAVMPFGRMDQPAILFLGHSWITALPSSTFFSCSIVRPACGRHFFPSGRLFGPVFSLAFF